MYFSIGPYTVEQRTDYSKIKLYNNETMEYIEDSTLLNKILDDWHKQTVCDDEYFKIEGTKLVGVKSNFHDKNIQYVFVPDYITEIGDHAFSGGLFKFIKFPEKLQKIKTAAFMGCRSLDYVNIPNGVSEIRSLAFRDCRSLTKINLPNLKEIDGETFYGCTNLENIEIPNSVEVIRTYAFRRCKKLECVKLPDNLNTIGDYAFSECERLKHIVLPNSLEYICDSSFILTDLKNIDIPDSVTEIGSSAFAACKNLESVKLSNNLRRLEKTTFANCTKLTNLVLPDNISRLDGQIFHGASCLDVVNIPKNLNIIENHPFENSSVDTLIINHDLSDLNTENPGDAEYGLIGKSSITKLIIDNSVKVISPNVFGDKIGRHIHTIDYLGTKKEFEEFKSNNLELFKILNVKEVKFLPEIGMNRSVEDKDRG